MYEAFYKNLHRFSVRKITLVFSALAVVVLGGVLLFSGRLPWGFERDIADSLHGQLVMTMTAANLVAPYVFDFNTGKLIHQSKTEGVLLLQSTTASSTGDTAYRCMSETKIPQVCIYRLATRSHHVISHNEYLLKRNLVWSPDEKSVLYVASVATTTSASIDPNEWVVFRAMVDGSQETRVATGSTAFFSPTGKSVFALQRDGLHEHDLASSTDRVAWPVTGGSANRFMTLAVSQDGTKLAWANPYSGPAGQQGKLSLFTVTSWHPFTLRFDTAVPLRVWQMQFSPDGRALALSVDSSDKQLGLYVYVLGSEPKKVLDLQAYERKTFISQWR